MQTEKKKKCIKIIKWRNYGLSAWENTRKDNSTWLNYEIQRSVYLGTDKQGNKNYDNRSLSLTKLEDLCYLKTMLKFVMARYNAKPIFKYNYVVQKVLDEEKVKLWKDKEKPSKEEMKEALKRVHFFRNYTDKEGNKKETKHFILNSSELDITRDFVDYCISKIENIYDSEKRMNNNSNYQDNVNYSQPEEKGEFIDEKIDDDIPF